MKTHFLGNEKQWILESHYPNYKTLESLFEVDRGAPVPNYQTSTFFGEQYNVSMAEVDEKHLLEHINNEFAKVQIPIELTSNVASWIIRYNNGWQKMHRHGMGDQRKCSFVIYLNDLWMPPEGATFAVVYDGKGNTHDLCYETKAGDMLIFDSTVLHGAYPVRGRKNIFVADYEYKIKETKWI